MVYYGRRMTDLQRQSVLEVLEHLSIQLLHCYQVVQLYLLLHSHQLHLHIGTIPVICNETY